MSKGRKHVAGNGVAESANPERSESNQGSEMESATTTTVPQETGTKEGETGNIGGGKKDRSNPPVYGIVGIRPNDEGMDLLATFPTRHQMQKNLAMVKRMVSRSYSALEYVKIKYLDMSDVES